MQSTARTVRATYDNIEKIGSSCKSFGLQGLRDLLGSWVNLGVPNEMSSKRKIGNYLINRKDNLRKMYGKFMATI